MEPIPSSLPVLPIRNAVLFPSISLPLVVGRDRSIAAIEQAAGDDNMIVVVAQRVVTPGDPQPQDLYEVGTLCKVESVATTETGSRQIVVTGVQRFRVGEYFFDRAGHLAARGQILTDTHGPDPVRNEALFLNLKDISREVLELLPGATEPLARLIERVDDPAYLSNVCAAYLSLSLPEKQELLELDEIEDRLARLLNYMRKEREVLQLQREIRDKMAERLNKAQREALLREQIRTIRTELGEEGGEESADDIETKLQNAGLPGEAGKVAREELKRLKALPANSAEYHVIRTYLEWLGSLPWNVRSPETIDIPRAKFILDEDHYGLDSVKRRILQFLAVAKLKNNLHGPILCLVGPPGVGKTSLGQSIARALGRKFIRASLGGVRDEAEIRGHRRTYVGAMPGRVIQSIKRAGTRNPVMMLDEIDKLHADFHGDPSAALLEVLDPEQNKNFVDHYLDVEFDLSDVFFIGTANVVDTIPPALRDRMEIIEVNGYTSFEKMHIARSHLIPKQLREHGLRPEWVILQDPALEKIIHSYTREAGVRELQRKIAAVFRAVAELLLETNGGAIDLSAAGGQIQPIEVTPQKLRDWLGHERYFPEESENIRQPGIAMGLAWTPHGGDVLFVEATALPEGKGQLTLTGQLGDVMKESAQLAFSLARSTIVHFLPTKFRFHHQDIHIHVPSGAIPKDGPSAGVTMLVALASLLSRRPVKSGIAMTGEITLRGMVLPVGGIKEKILAAHRANIKTVLIPAKNEPDLDDVPPDVRSQMHFLLANTVDQALAHALDLRPVRSAEFPRIAPAA